MQSITELIREKNIELATTDPVARGGFTQVPNFILRNPDLSAGAKVVYSMFLSYAWHNESCFPGQERLAKDLSARVAGIKDVDVLPSGRGAHQLRFHDRWSKTEFTPAEVSDGTILMLAFLALRYQPLVPDLITIEEPERGLHPYLLGELVAFLRSLTEGPKPLQIVVATHSAEFLEHMKPEEVRFLSRSPLDGNVVVREADPSSPDWVRFYREYDDSLGSAWLSGSLGGVPNTN